MDKYRLCERIGLPAEAVKAITRYDAMENRVYLRHKERCVKRYLLAGGRLDSRSGIRIEGMDGA